MTPEEVNVACDELKSLALRGPRFDDVSIARARSILQDLRHEIRLTQPTRVKLRETAEGFVPLIVRGKLAAQRPDMLKLELVQQLQELCQSLEKDLTTRDRT